MKPLPIAQAWSLYAREDVDVLDEPRLAHQAKTFFGVELRFVPRDPELAGAFDIDVLGGDANDETRVRVITVSPDDAPDVRIAGEEAVDAIGGAGFDALLPKAKRYWQVATTPVDGRDTRAPLVVAAVLASVMLAPIVPPGGGTVFGVKGARERLAAMGWKI
jgi:hypothetical protein